MNKNYYFFVAKRDGLTKRIAEILTERSIPFEVIPANEEGLLVVPKEKLNEKLKEDFHPIVVSFDQIFVDGKVQFIDWETIEDLDDERIGVVEDCCYEHNPLRMVMEMLEDYEETDLDTCLINYYYAPEDHEYINNGVEIMVRGCDGDVKEIEDVLTYIRRAQGITKEEDEQVSGAIKAITHTGNFEKYFQNNPGLAVVDIPHEKVLSVFHTLFWHQRFQDVLVFTPTRAVYAGKDPIAEKLQMHFMQEEENPYWGVAEIDLAKAEEAEGLLDRSEEERRNIIRTMIVAKCNNND